MTFKSAFLTALGALLLTGCVTTTHLGVTPNQLVQIRWQVVADSYGGYFIRDIPDGTHESHWSVPPGKVFVITDYSFHLYGGTAGQTEAVELKRRNLSLDEPFHFTTVVLGPDGGGGAVTSLTSGVVVNTGTELMFRMRGTTGGTPTLNNWALVEGYLLDRQ
jgi:hypothetical protein